MSCFEEAADPRTVFGGHAQQTELLMVVSPHQVAGISTSSAGGLRGEMSALVMRRGRADPLGNYGHWGL